MWAVYCCIRNLRFSTWRWLYESDLYPKVRKMSVTFLMSLRKMSWACDHVNTDSNKPIFDLNNWGQGLDMTIQRMIHVLIGLNLWNENEMNRASGHFCTHTAKLGQENLLRMVRWMIWHCPPDTGFEIQTMWFIFFNWKGEQKWPMQHDDIENCDFFDYI